MKVTGVALICLVVFAAGVNVGIFIYHEHEHGRIPIPRPPWDPSSPAGTRADNMTASLAVVVPSRMELLEEVKVTLFLQGVAQNATGILSLRVVSSLGSEVYGSSDLLGPGPVMRTFSFLLQYTFPTGTYLLFGKAFRGNMTYAEGIGEFVVTEGSLAWRKYVSDTFAWNEANRLRGEQLFQLFAVVGWSLFFSFTITFELFRANKLARALRERSWYDKTIKQLERFNVDRAPFNRFVPGRHGDVVAAERRRYTQREYELKKLTEDLNKYPEKAKDVLAIMKDLEILRVSIKQKEEERNLVRVEPLAENTARPMSREEVEKLPEKAREKPPEILALREVTTPPGGAIDAISKPGALAEVTEKVHKEFRRLMDGGEEEEQDGKSK